MAHFKKYTQVQTYSILDHDRRGHTEKRDHIDKTKTCNNYNLAEHSQDPYGFVKDKIDMSKKSGGRVNSRTVSLVSCIVTMPTTYDGDPREFFETVKEFLDMHFGADNCASAWVHVDEASQHLHYCVCPIEKKENGVLQFNAKKQLNRQYLETFHTELQDYCESRLGRSVEILNGATTDGNLTTKQLKKQQQKTNKLREEYDTLIDDYNNLVDDYNDLIEQVSTLRNTVARLESKLKQYSHIADDILDDQPSRITHENDEPEW